VAFPTPVGKRGEQHFVDTWLSRPKFMKAGRAVVRVHLGKPLMQQVLGEAMSVDTIARAVKEQMKGKIEGQGEVSLLFLEGNGRRFIVSPPTSAA
jgi:hypothetical protein